MRNISDVDFEERVYNRLVLKTFNKINSYVLKSNSGNSLLTIMTGTQYRCIQNKKPHTLKQLMVDILSLDFEENFPVSEEPIIKQILLWIENRLSLHDDAPQSASVKIEKSFFELTFDGIVCERGLQYVSYINTLKTFLFEIRSYLSVKVNLKAFSKFVLSDKTIDIYRYST